MPFVRGKGSRKPDDAPVTTDPVDDIKADTEPADDEFDEDVDILVEEVKKKERRSKPLDFSRAEIAQPLPKAPPVSEDAEYRALIFNRDLPDTTFGMITTTPEIRRPDPMTGVDRVIQNHVTGAPNNRSYKAGKRYPEIPAPAAKHYVERGLAVYAD